MNRRRFLLTSLAGALAAPLATGAQAGTLHRIPLHPHDALGRLGPPSAA